MKHKFKIGDRVQFKSWKELKDEFGEDSYGNIDLGYIYFSFDMKPLCNTYATIIGIRGNDTGEVELDEFSNEEFFEDADNYHFRYLTNMLKPVKEEKKSKKNLASEDSEDCIEYGLEGIKHSLGGGIFVVYDEIPIDKEIEYHEKRLAELKAQKEKGKWVFTEDEKVVLRNLSRDIEWIVRDKDGALWAFKGKPSREDTFWFGDVSCIKYEVDCFSHIFQCIQWTDTEPCEFRKYI